MCFANAPIMRYCVLFAAWPLHSICTGWINEDALSSCKVVTGRPIFFLNSNWASTLFWDWHIATYLLLFVEQMNCVYSDDDLNSVFILKAEASFRVNLVAFILLVWPKFEILMDPAGDQLWDIQLFLSNNYRAYAVMALEEVILIFNPCIRYYSAFVIQLFLYP